jgi:hypothetical protein
MTQRNDLGYFVVTELYEGCYIETEDFATARAMVDRKFPNAETVKLYYLGAVIHVRHKGKWTR